MKIGSREIVAIFAVLVIIFVSLYGSQTSDVVVLDRRPQYLPPPVIRPRYLPPPIIVRPPRHHGGHHGHHGPPIPHPHPPPPPHPKPPKPIPVVPIPKLPLKLL